MREPLPAPPVCPSCGHSMELRFCPNCGEKKIDRHDFSLKHFISETLEGFTHFDNKFFRTIKWLIVKPGFLSREFVEGKRIGYMKPLQLFIVCNLIFFAIMVGGNPFMTSLKNFYNYNPVDFLKINQSYLRQKADSKLLKLKVSFSEYEEIFDAKMRTESKAFLFILIPAIAIFFQLLLIRTRRYFTEHLIFSTHFLSFILVYFIAVFLFISLPLNLLTQINYSSAYDSIILWLTAAIIFVYLLFGSRRFYNLSWLSAITIACIMPLYFLYIVELYRLILFLKIIYS